MYVVHVHAYKRCFTQLVSIRYIITRSVRNMTSFVVHVSAIADFVGGQQVGYNCDSFVKGVVRHVKKCDRGKGVQNTLKKCNVIIE